MAGLLNARATGVHHHAQQLIFCFQFIFKFSYKGIITTLDLTIVRKLSKESEAER